MIPPAASTGTSRIGLIAFSTSGTRTMVVTSPQWPPASVPCDDQDVDAGADLADGVLLGADQRGDRHAVRLPISIISGGGTPSALAISLIGCSKAASSVRSAVSGSNGCGRSSETSTCCSCDAGLRQQVGGELAVLVGDAGLQQL